MSSAKPAFVCASCARALRKSTASLSKRALATATTTARHTETAQYDDRKQVPRWQQTPPAMKMAFRLRPQPDQPVWKINENPVVLDNALNKFVGDAAGEGIKGADLLEEEVKVWVFLKTIRGD